MSISSMTGFARVDGAFEGTTWTWEIRSVNGRGLDVRTRLAPGSDSLDARVREACGKRFQRGSIQVNLAVRRDLGQTEIRLNEAAFKQVLAISRRAAEIAGSAPASLESLLAIRGVLDVAEPEEPPAAATARLARMEATLREALDALKAARMAEGLRLRAIVAEQLDRVAQHTAIAAGSPARAPDAIVRRLAEQVQRLLQGNAQLDPVRLHQEAALLAARADIEEEVQRLGSHVTAARALLAQGSGVGRQLDFLAQEFNREANTLCSKANAPDMTNAGLALKVVIDQMREQVQNVE